ncbi:MAG: hypothetical protein WB992_23565 [Bryobacteraceae bacterium]
MARLPLMHELLLLQPPAIRSSVLREAGLDPFGIAAISDDLEAGRSIDFPLTPEEIDNLLAVVLRRTPIEDSVFGDIVSQAGIKLRDKTGTDVVVSVPFAREGSDYALPITELAASSLIVWEISLRVKQVLEAINTTASFSPPEVNVTVGSTSFSFGGGTMLVSGIGLVIAAHAALPLGVAATIAFWGGSLVSAMGITDLIFSWTRTSAEREKFLVEKDKLAAETHKPEAETRKILIENAKAAADAKSAEAQSLLDAAREKLLQSDHAKERSPLSPPSALLTQEEIRSQAKLYGIPLALATHLINRVLPSVADATRNYPQKVTSTPRSSGRAAAAGH